MRSTLRALAIAAATSSLLTLPMGLGGQAAVAGANCTHVDHTHRHWHGFNPHTHHWVWAGEITGPNYHYEVFYFVEGDYFQSSSNCDEGGNVLIDSVVTDTVTEELNELRKFISG